MKINLTSFAQIGKSLLKPSLAALLMTLCSSPAFVHSNQTNVFLQATQGVPNFGGMTARNGKLLICGYNKNVRIFNPATAQFEGSTLVLPAGDFSFPNDITIIPADPARGIIGGFSCTSFLDGRIWTKLNDGTVLESSIFVPEHATNTGVYDFTFDPFLQGAQPIDYRKSNDRLYTQSGFDPSQMWKLDWRGSVPESIPLTPNALLNTFQFGPDDKLYAPDVLNGIIVKVDVDTGAVTQIPTSISVPHPISLRISKGSLYILSRTTGGVFKHNLATGITKLLTTLDPALADLTFNENESKLYATNDQSTIYEINPDTGSKKIIFHSPIVGPWDLAFDSDRNSVYVADNGTLREFDSITAQPRRKLTLDSAANSGLNGFGLVCGIQVEQGSNAEIVISDITLGAIAVVNKSNFAVKTIFGAFEIGIPQIFSAVHVKNVPPVHPGDPAEFYLAASPTDGSIYKLWRDSYPSGALHKEPYITGLTVPVKLKVRNGFLYIVDAGRVLENIPNTGKVSRVKISQTPSPSDIQVLVTGLNKPEGFDIFDNKMLIVEADSNRIVQASAIAPSTPTVVQSNLHFEDGNLIYQFAPVKIHPLTGLCVDLTGQCIFVNQTKDVNILKITRNVE